MLGGTPGVSEGRRPLLVHCRDGVWRAPKPLSETGLQSFAPNAPSPRWHRDAVPGLSRPLDSASWSRESGFGFEAAGLSLPSESPSVSPRSFSPRSPRRSAPREAPLLPLKRLGWPTVRMSVSQDRMRPRASRGPESVRRFGAECLSKCSVALCWRLLRPLLAAVLCFFGGGLEVLLGALEAFRTMGGAAVLELSGLRQMLTDTSTDKKSAKLLDTLLLMDPKRLESAAASLWLASLALLCAVKLRFVRTVAFALAFADMAGLLARLLRPLPRLLRRKLRRRPEAEAEAEVWGPWAETITDSLLKALALAAVCLMPTPGVWYSALRGARLMRLTPQDLGLKSQWALEFMALLVAAAGVYWQLSPHFFVPSAVATLLWPCRETERQLAERRSEPARLQRLEEALAEAPGQQAIRDAARAADLAMQAEQKAWAAAKAARAAAAAAGAPSEAEDLGMDWAAWTAGAEIDHSHTSQGLGRTLWARAGRVLACLAPSWRMSLGASQAPEVVLTWETGPPSRCFTFDGAVGELSIRFWQPLRPSHVVLEQSPNWALANPRASPRHFEVRAWRAGDVSQYEVRLGRFEYQLAQGGSQVFNLTSDGTALRGLVRGLQFRFEDNWGEEGRCLVATSGVEQT
ncbi:unnamed protein product [Effrenium voratum]|nr:unnamed protein product [Effrenium voratum]